MVLHRRSRKLFCPRCQRQFPGAGFPLLAHRPRGNYDANRPTYWCRYCLQETHPDYLVPPSLKALWTAIFWELAWRLVRPPSWDCYFTLPCTTWYLPSLPLLYAPFGDCHL